MLKRFLPFSITVVAVAGALTAKFGPLDMARPAQAQAGGPTSITDQYIVVFKESVTDPAEAAADIARHNGGAVGHVYSAALKGFSGRVAPQRLRHIKNDPRVDYVEQDIVVHALGQTLPTGVDRIDAQSSPTAKIDGLDERVNVDIAILDTGIQTNHPDLNVVGGKNFTGGNQKAYGDGNGHGTHVAGSAAAKDNNIGVVGVAPGARLWSVRVLDNNGNGALSWIIAGIDYVTQNARTIEVANMSLGFQGSSSSLDAAISRSVAAGVTYVVAAGNSAADASSFSPANHRDVICVSAINDADGRGGLDANGSALDTFSWFSNFGEVVDIAAPGVSIYSTLPGSGYGIKSGTSMASPHVAGAAALYKARSSGATPVLVKAALLGAAAPQNSANGFSGDPDTSAEPVLNVSGL